jgi:uncharacterized protein (TIGR03089 family)
VRQLSGPIPGGVTGAVLGPLLAGDPHRPRLTVYGADGARTELSTASLANWSAKVAGLLVDELGLAPRDRVSVQLPAGWQTAPVLLGCWWAGLTVLDGRVSDAPVSGVPLSSGQGVAAAFVADGEDADAEEVFVVSGHPLGAPSRSVQPHQRDFTAAVLPQADRFAPGARVAATDVVLTSGSEPVDLAGMLTQVQLAASRLGTGARMLTDAPWTFPGGVAGTLLAALAADGSVVQLLPGSGVDPTAVAAAERATVTSGLEVPGLPTV